MLIVIKLRAQLSNNQVRSLNLVLPIILYINFHCSHYSRVCKINLSYPL
jgi:hypothetical protein